MSGINVRHLLIVALGYNEILHEEIEKLYDKKRWEYYETFKNSGFYDDMVIRSFSPMREDKMKKVAGIVEWCYNNNDFTLINQLINKGYKNVVRYFQQYKNRLDIQELSIYIEKRKKQHSGNISELELSMHHNVFMYLCHQERIDMGRIFSTSYGQVAFEAIKSLIVDLGHRIRQLEYIKKEEKVKNEIQQFITKALGIDIEKKFPERIDNFFDYVIDNGVTEELSAKGKNKKNAYIEEIAVIRDNLFNKGIFKYIGAISSVLKLSQLNYSDILDAKITKDDLMLYAYNAMKRKTGNRYTDEEINHFFVASIYLHSLITQYKKQKESLVDDSNEAWYLDVKNREVLIKDKEQFYERMKDNLERELNEKGEKYNDLLDKQSRLEKEVERLRKEQESFKADREELVELRNFVYQQKRVDITHEDNDINEAINSLRKNKIIVCGGHPNFQRKLKDVIPNLDLLDTDTLSKNFSFLKKYDAVYFYPNYANHSFYKKVKAAIAGSNTKFIYLPDIDNVESIVVNMYESINEKVSI